MMNKKKLLSTICAAALTVSVAGTSIVSAIAADKDADLLKGKVTDIDGTTVTLQVGAPMGAPGQKDDGAGQLPPAKPDGEVSDDLTPPAKPEGDESDDLTPPAKPEGEQDDTKQPPEAKTVELDVSDAAITEDGEDAAAEDIEVGDMLTVELDEDGNVVSVTIDNLPAMDGEFDPDKKPAPDDGLDPSEKPDPIDGDFAPEDKPLPDEDFDPTQKPAFDDNTFAPDDQPAAGGQFTPVGQPGQDAPRGGFNGAYDAARLQHGIGQNGVLNLDLSQPE